MNQAKLDSLIAQATEFFNETYGQLFSSFALYDEFKQLRYMEASASFVQLLELYEANKDKSSEEIDTALRAFLKERWSHIRKATAITNPFDLTNPMNRACRAIAESLYDQRHDDDNDEVIHPYLLLMPTIKVIAEEDIGTNKPLTELKLTDFIVSDDGERMIEIAAVIDLAKEDAELKYYRENTWKYLSEHEKQSLFLQQPNAVKQFKLIQEKLDLKKGADLGARLHQLLLAIQGGSVKHGDGEELAAGVSAYNGIIAFNDYLKSFKNVPDHIFALKSKCGNYVFRDIWNLLNRDKNTNYESVRFCLNSICGQLAVILKDNKVLFEKLTKAEAEIASRAPLIEVSRNPAHIFQSLDRDELKRAVCMTIEGLSHTQKNALKKRLPSYGLYATLQEWADINNANLLTIIPRLENDFNYATEIFTSAYLKPECLVNSIAQLNAVFASFLKKEKMSFILAASKHCLFQLLQSVSVYLLKKVLQDKSCLTLLEQKLTDDELKTLFNHARTQFDFPINVFDNKRLGKVALAAQLTQNTQYPLQDKIKTIIANEYFKVVIDLIPAKTMSALLNALPTDDLIALFNDQACEDLLIEKHRFGLLAFLLRANPNEPAVLNQLNESKISRLFRLTNNFKLIVERLNVTSTLNLIYSFKQRFQLKPEVYLPAIETILDTQQHKLSQNFYQILCQLGYIGPLLKAETRAGFLEWVVINKSLPEVINIFTDKNYFFELTKGLSYDEFCHIVSTRDSGIKLEKIPFQSPMQVFVLQVATPTELFSISFDVAYSLICSEKIDQFLEKLSQNSCVFDWLKSLKKENALVVLQQEDFAEWALSYNLAG